MKSSVIAIGLASALFATGAAAQASPPLEVKGVPLGSGPTDFASAFPGGLRCYNTECFAEYSIDKNVKYGPAYVSEVKARLIQGRVESITIVTLGFGFDDLAAAMIAKYGKPTEDVDSPVQNRLGATFHNRQVAWTLPGGAILLTQRSGDINHSATVISSDSMYLAKGRSLVVAFSVPRYVGEGPR